MLPTPEAIATLSDMLARTGFLPSAMSLYAQLRVDDLSTLVPLTRSHRQMFEQLLELNCREGRVQTALEVFDDWKAASDLAEQAAARLTAIEVQVRASQYIAPPPPCVRILLIRILLATMLPYDRKFFQRFAKSLGI